MAFILETKSYWDASEIATLLDIGVLQFWGFRFYFVTTPLPDSINKDENRNTLKILQDSIEVNAQFISHY